MAHPHGWVWIRVDDPEHLERLKIDEELGDVLYEPEKAPYARILRYLKSDDCPRWVDSEDIRKNMARVYGPEVIAFYDSDAGYVLYTHWVNGQCVRHLDNYMDVWRAFGEPEPWEESAFFGKNEFGHDVVDYWRDDARNDEDLRAIDRIWAGKRVVDGERWPISGHVENALLRHYGFADAWTPRRQ